MLIAVQKTWGLSGLDSFLTFFSATPDRPTIEGTVTGISTTEDKPKVRRLPLALREFLESWNLHHLLFPECALLPLPLPPSSLRSPHARWETASRGPTSLGTGTKLRSRFPATVRGRQRFCPASFRLGSVSFPAPFPFLLFAKTCIFLSSPKSEHISQNHLRIQWPVLCHEWAAHEGDKGSQKRLLLLRGLLLCPRGDQDDGLAPYQRHCALWVPQPVFTFPSFVGVSEKVETLFFSTVKEVDGDRNTLEIQMMAVRTLPSSSVAVFAAVATRHDWHDTCQLIKKAIISIKNQKSSLPRSPNVIFPSLTLQGRLIGFYLLWRCSVAIIPKLCLTLR